MKTFVNVKCEYKPKTNSELKDLVNDLSIKLWEIDTSLIDDMTDLFYMSRRKKNEDFEGIEYWDVSNVRNMKGMFYSSTYFNQPLNNWNVSNVEVMTCMFSYCVAFNQPLNNWNVSKVTDMRYMFFNCHKLDQKLNNWSMSDSVNVIGMFDDCDIKEEFKPKVIK